MVGYLEFYYLLQVGRYTVPEKRGQQPKTQKKSVNVVTFFKLRVTCGLLLPVPLNIREQERLVAVSGTLHITK